MADDISVIYRRYRPKICWPKVIKSKHKNYSRHNADGKTTKRFSNVHGPCSNATYIKSKSSFREWRDTISAVKQNTRKHKRKKSNGQQIPQRPQLSAKGSTCLTTDEYLKILSKKCSTPIKHDLEDDSSHGMKRTRSDTQLNSSTPYESKFIVNTLSLDPNSIQSERQHVLTHPLMQARLRIYRCQLSTTEESCCCSCNSDAMFEVMKGLYDCYTKKTCDNCNCVLCGHLPKEEQELGKVPKSLASIGVETDTAEQIIKDKWRKAKEAGFLVPLAGLPPDQREKILRGLANLWLPLPEGKTPSQMAVISKVRQDLGLPPSPKSAAEQDKHENAAKLGLLQPLEGKSTPDKEKLLKNWYDLNMELPEGRTASEKSIIANIKKTAGPKEVSGLTLRKISKSKTAGLLTPLEGKTPEQKEKILRGLALSGIPLPGAKTPSLKKLVQKVKRDLGLPPTPKSAAEQEKQDTAAKLGLMIPLLGKSRPEKENILRNLNDMGIELPEGRSPSEKSLIEMIKASPFANICECEKLALSGSQKLAYTKAVGPLTPLEGKTSEQKQKILRDLAISGAPLTAGKTESEKKLIAKVAEESKALPSKVYNKATSSVTSSVSEKLRRAKAAGILTTLDKKTPEQREKIIRGLAMLGLPLPEGKTPSVTKLLGKVRNDLGLPPEPKTIAEKNKYSKAQAAGLIKPLEGKTPAEKEKILRALANKSIPLPIGRTPHEKALIKKILAETKKVPSAGKVASEKMRKAALAGLSIPLQGKTTEQKEKMLRDIAMNGGLLPDANTPSLVKLIDKVRKDLGLPPTPKTNADKDKYAKAQTAGFMLPLEGKTPEHKEKILEKWAEKNIPLPEGRTASEKSLIKKIQADVKAVSSKAKMASEKMRKAKAAGLAGSLTGKSPEQKAQMLHNLANRGYPLPEGKTASEKALIDSVRKILDEQTAKNITEGKGSSDECICHILAPESVSEARKSKSAGVVIPKKTTLSAREAQAARLIPSLEGKSPAERERILRGLAKARLPLPEGTTPSFKALTDKIRNDMGLPPEPQSPAMKEKLRKGYADGIVTPLNSKTSAQKENVLKKLKNAGLDLPEGRTASEKSLIRKIKAPKAGIGIAPLLDGKTSSQKERILKQMAAPGKGRTPAEKATIAKRAKLREAKAAGLLTPLTGKSPEEQERIVKALLKAGLPLPDGTTPSEKALINRVKDDFDAGKVSTKLPAKTQSAKLREAKAAGLLTPLTGKSPEEQEIIVKALLKAGLPLPDGTSPSEKALIKRVKDDFDAGKVSTNLPAKTQSANLREAKAAGLLTPLTGKNPEAQERILKAILKAGLPLPDGTTPSEKALIKRVKDDFDAGKVSTKLPAKTQSAKLREAKAAGLLTPLTGKSPVEQERIVKTLLKAGLPLPDGTTPSEKALIKRVKDDFDAGKVSTKLPAKTQSAKLREAKAAGLWTPLTGKSPEEQERIVKALLRAGLPLPDGNTPSEKALIKKIKDDFDAGKVSTELPAKTQAKLQKAKAAGLLTPLKGKDPKTQEKIVKGLLKAGLPLPEGTTPSEKALINRVQHEFDAAKKAGLSPEGIGKTDSGKIRKAKASGLDSTLKGKTLEEKRKIIKDLIQAGLPLPKVTTPSEKEMVKKLKASAKPAISGLPVPEGGDSRSKKRIRKSRGTKAAGAGIQKEIQEIVKTDKCDAACGCDKKKIRFKHSYVKIRVTSPDISSFCPCPNECIPGVKAGVFTDSDGIKVTVGSVGINKYKVHPYINKRSLHEISSLCSHVLCSKVCVSEGVGACTDKEGTQFTVDIPSYTEHPQITKGNSHENKRSLQSFKESLLPLNIALIGNDCATDDLDSSKSTVYIFNSESDINTSDIERFFRFTLNNDNSKKKFMFKTSGEEKPVSYIHRSCFADSSGDFRSSLQIPSTISTTSLRSLYTNTIYKTESSLSHTADLATSMTTYYNMCDSDMLSNVFYPENHLKNSSQFISTPQSTERVDDMGSTSTNMLPKKGPSYLSNYLGEFSSQLVATEDTSCASHRSRHPMRGIKRNLLELKQEILSNKSLSSSSVFMVISSSGHGNGSSFLHATDTLSNVSHSEPSSLFLMNKRPQISLLALNMWICAKFISKAEEQRDFWKRKKDKAGLRLRNMAQELLLQMQNVRECTSNKYTSSTVASQEQKHVEHTAKKNSALCRKWMANRGNRVVYNTKHSDIRIDSFSSSSSYGPSTGTVSTTSTVSTLHSPEVYINSQVTTRLRPEWTLDPDPGVQRGLARGVHVKQRKLTLVS